MRKKTKVFSADSSGFLQLAIMITAKKIHASRYTPILSKDVLLNTGMIRNVAVSIAVTAANTMTAGQLMLSPLYSLSSILFLFFSMRLYLRFSVYVRADHASGRCRVNRFDEQLRGLTVIVDKSPGADESVLLQHLTGAPILRITDRYRETGQSGIF